MRTKDACLDGPEVATESSLRGVRTGGSPSRYCAHGLYRMPYRMMEAQCTGWRGRQR